MVLLKLFLLFCLIQLGFNTELNRNKENKQGTNECGIPEIKSIQNILPEADTCKTVNEFSKGNDNYNFINYFGTEFKSLMKGIDSLIFPDKNGKMDTIFFIGNTGSGKSTTVQILGSDNHKIFSRPVGESDFVIIDNSKIGTDTLTSETLYPDLLVDKETGYVLCDNPGFRDTRSSIHEIVALYSIKQVIRHTNRMKIVIVSTHASVKIGMYREDFINVLKHTTDLIKNIDKYGKSVYLLATKVENVYARQKLVSDKSIITDIRHYLETVKLSLSNKINVLNETENKILFYDNCIKLIDNLLQKNKNEPSSKIEILRKPDDEGPLITFHSIQVERTKIRNMLLNDINLVKVDEKDFGLSLSDSALIYLSDLYEKMNSHMTELTKLISLYLSNAYQVHIRSNSDMNEVIKYLTDVKEKIKLLSNKIGESKHPTEYIKIINNFSKENNLHMDCLTGLQNTTTLNDYLVKLEDFISSSKYTPSTWNMTMKSVIDFVDNKLQQYKFISDMFQLLSSYKIQKNKKLYNVKNVQHWGTENKQPGLKIDENNFSEFLKQINFHGKYTSSIIDEMLIMKLNPIIDISLKYQYSTLCNNNTLTLIGTYVVVSEIENIIYQKCGNGNKIIIFAIHTLYIDKDLNNNVLNGKSLVIVAPLWHTIGTRKISVEGKAGGENMPKANFNEIGRNGNNGMPGGTFFGIGQTFINGENLEICASGGNGQNGQDGGDGMDGKDGENGKEQNFRKIDGDSRNLIVYSKKKNIYKADAIPGEVGGNSGGGGKGGNGGKKGKATLYNIGSEPHYVSLVIADGKNGINGKDGKPGKGGKSGCDLLEVRESERVLFFGGSDNSKEFINCGIKSADGIVRRTSLIVPAPLHASTDNTPPCEYIRDFNKRYIKEYHSLLLDGITKHFINRMIFTKF